MNRPADLAGPADPGLAGAQRRFAAHAREPWAIWLDSGPERHYPAAQCDYFAIRPRVTLVTHGATTAIGERGDVPGEYRERERSDGDPLVLLRRERAAAPGTMALGYWGYDLGRRFERWPARARDDLGLPQMAVGLYDCVLAVPRRAGAAHRRGPAGAPDWVEAWLGPHEPPLPGAAQALRPTGTPRTTLDEAEYARAFARVQRYIRDGDCYQVNLAQRFSVPVAGDAWSSYLAWRELSPAPFGAWLQLPFATLMSISPERFLRVDGRRVETRPIKGTRPRLAEPRADRALAAALAASAKDRAENLMIVDLLRNDLGRCCEIGSVAVPRLFEVESYATVHHLVSTVTGTLAAGRDTLDLVRAAFPGGSITGAPKLRAIEIIDELEPVRRGVYCGSIGRIDANGDLDLSIAIRTAVLAGGELHYWAGGGLVADSVCADEYQESHDKARAFFRLLGLPTPERRPGAAR
jgi:para-aminobenzoate synthetase component 1